MIGELRVVSILSCHATCAPLRMSVYVVSECALTRRIPCISYSGLLALPGRGWSWERETSVAASVVVVVGQGEHLVLEP